MYKFEESTTAEPKQTPKGRKFGPKVKTDERVALETIPVGMVVRFPKDKAPTGSIQNWTWAIGRDRGIKFTVRSDGAYWEITAHPRIP